MHSSFQTFGNSTGHRPLLRVTRCIVPLIVLAFQLSTQPVAHGGAIVPGINSGQLDPDLKGLILIEELNCAACHSAGGDLATRSKRAPRLSEIGSRVNPGYLESFIRDPHGNKPGTTMPDVLTHLEGEERQRVAKSITHFLLSLKGNEFALQPPDAVAAQQGRRLFHSRGCAQCHSPRDEQGRETLEGSSTPLGALDRKYGFNSLVQFLRRPHASRPSGRMPDLRLSGQDVERIAHYLLQDTQVPGALRYTLYRGRVWEGIGGENVQTERAGHVEDFEAQSLGKLSHHTAIQFSGWIHIANPGSHTFFLTLNGGSLLLDQKPVVEQTPSDRRGVRQLQGTVELDAGWHAIQLTYFHTGHDPKFALEMEGPGFARARIPSSMLSVSDQPIPAFIPLQPDAELATRGREYFGSYGCAKCHDDLKVESKAAIAWNKLDSNRGCLSGVPGPWPEFALTAEQRRWITLALPHAEQPQLDDQRAIHKTLAAFNCIACHEREGLGGIAPERNSLFTGTQPGLGDQGRLPPPLTHVGAKLKPEWLAEVLLRGGRQRPYVDASMPQFGEAQVGHLVERLGKVDALEAAAIPEPVQRQEWKDAGHALTGIDGLSCIVCHEFNGQRSGEVGAVDLVRMTERLKKNWFHLYLRQPARFHPTVIMPGYWPEGRSVRPQVLGGDAAQQIEALWTYLEDGTRARKPVGLSRESNELRVADVTEICRGQSPVGYRGIAVGYPERINLAFDSGEMALRQLWKNDFVSVDPGRFRPRGTDSVSFPPGIPFHRLESLDDNWPYKGKANHAFPQDHGYQFRGYHLNGERKPTFLYQYGDITVADFFEDVRDPNGKAFFRRTLRLETPTEPAPFHFRAAAGPGVIRQSDRSFTLGQLQLRIVSDHRGIVREGESVEVLIPLSLSKGRSTLILDYQW